MRNKLQSQHGDIYYYLILVGRSQGNSLRAMLYVKGLIDIFCLSGWGFAVQEDWPFCLYSFQQQETLCCKIRWAGLGIKGIKSPDIPHTARFISCMYEFTTDALISYSFHLQVVQFDSILISMHILIKMKSSSLDCLLLFFQPITDLLIFYILWACKGNL